MSLDRIFEPGSCMDVTKLLWLIVPLDLDLDVGRVQLREFELPDEMPRNAMVDLRSFDLRAVVLRGGALQDVEATAMRPAEAEIDIWRSDRDCGINVGCLRFSH